MYFFVFFLFVNMCTKDMIKTPVFFVIPSSKKTKIRNEFIKKMSIIKQKFLFYFGQVFFRYTLYKDHKSNL